MAAPEHPPGSHIDKKTYAVVAIVAAIIIGFFSALPTIVELTNSQEPAPDNRVVSSPPIVALEAQISGPDVINTNTTHKWSGKDSGPNIVSWEWKIDDVFAGSQPFLEYIFTKTGTHYITLTIKDLNDTPSISKPFEVTVIDVPVHKITINKGSSSPDCVNDDSCYDPSSLTIQKGEIVQWINNDDFSHNITSGNLADGPDGFFESGIELIKTGESFGHTFNQSGTFEYFCQVHPWKQGTIIIE